VADLPTTVTSSSFTTLLSSKAFCGARFCADTDTAPSQQNKNMYQHFLIELTIELTIKFPAAKVGVFGFTINP
jgi:hypothetical protein